MSEDRAPRGQRESEAHGSHGKNDHRSVTGDIRVVGEIKTNIPPDFVKEYHTANEENNAREDKRFIVEVITLIFVALVAVFGAIQTSQAIKSAAAAKSAADTASATLHVSQRAYLVTGKPILASKNHFMDIPILNIGNIPSGKGSETTHWATVSMIPGINADEGHWRVKHFRYIGKGATEEFIRVVIPTLSDEGLNTGTQSLTVVVEISYNDGFDDDPQQINTFCFIAQQNPRTSLLETVSCDPDIGLALVKRVEKFPANQEVNTAK